MARRDFVASGQEIIYVLGSLLSARNTPQSIGNHREALNRLIDRAIDILDEDPDLELVGRISLELVKAKREVEKNEECEA